MPSLQDIIHKFEEGVWMRRLRKFLVMMAVVLFIALCNARNFKNFSSPEAMDTAQLARNISEGRGYTTYFVRPFSMYLLKTANIKRLGPPSAESKADYSRIRDMQPDVSNPPVYPVILAGWMKAYHGILKGLEAIRSISPGFIKGHLPTFNDSTQNPLWMKNSALSSHPRDFFIGVFNQLLLFVVIILIYFWAKRMFDKRVALVSAVLLFFSELLWRFSFSGLSTMLLLLIFMGVVWLLTLFDRELREPKWSANRTLLLAAGIGILVGLGGLTRYSFLWLIVPVMIFVFLFGGARKYILALVVFAAFAVVMTPWLIRNYHLTGTFFGTSSYTVFEGATFPGFHLQRALHPDLNHTSVGAIWQKLWSNLRGVLQNDLPLLGGSWVTALFLAGLLIGFLNVAIRRMRYFLLMSFGMLVFVQALGHTQLTDESPVYNSENLLVLLVPLVVVYGVSLFFIFLDQMSLPVIQLRYLVIGIFTVVASLPMIFTFMPPRPSAIIWPPYYAPMIENIASWTKQDELIMSDIPWAVAWYGHRQSIWLTFDVQTDFSETEKNDWEQLTPAGRELKEKRLTVARFPDFFEVYDFEKTISALYLTQKTMDGHFLSDWLKAGEKSWATFILEAGLQQKIPLGFPLNKAARSGFWPDQFFLSDWERWNKSE